MLSREGLPGQAATGWGQLTYYGFSGCEAPRSDSRPRVEMRPSADRDAGGDVAATASGVDRAAPAKPTKASAPQPSSAAGEVGLREPSFLPCAGAPPSPQQTRRLHKPEGGTEAGRRTGDSVSTALALGDGCCIPTAQAGVTRLHAWRGAMFRRRHPSAAKLVKHKWKSGRDTTASAADTAIPRLSPQNSVERLTGHTRLHPSIPGTRRLINAAVSPTPTALFSRSRLYRASPGKHRTSRKTPQAASSGSQALPSFSAGVWLGFGA